MKKGFTLIELLAVIVILAVIALIATPLIMNVINDAKKNSFKDSALSIVRTLELASADALDYFDPEMISSGLEVGVDLSKEELKYNGSKPKAGYAIMTKEGEVALEMNDGSWCIKKETNESEVQITSMNESDPCDGKRLISQYLSWDSSATKQNPTETDKHKGIVYLDPTDLSKTCTKTLSDGNINSNGKKTGVKTGCMTFYVYAIDDVLGGYAHLILDHNTTARVAYNFSGDNQGLGSSVYELKNQFYQDTMGWDSSLNPRMITAVELARASDNTTFEEATEESGHFYFGSNGIDSSKKDQYSWLYDNLYDSASNGGTVSDNNAYPFYTNANGDTWNAETYGYWTVTKVNNSNSKIWCVRNGGDVGAYPADDNGHGIRPVISIPKYVLDM